MKPTLIRFHKYIGKVYLVHCTYIMGTHNTLTDCSFDNRTKLLIAGSISLFILPVNMINDLLS